MRLIDWRRGVGPRRGRRCPARRWGRRGTAPPSCLLLTADPSPGPGINCTYGEAALPPPQDGASGVPPTPPDNIYRFYLDLGNEASGTGSEASRDNSLALNHRVPGVDPDETLWMSYEDWDAAVNHYKSACSSC